MMKKGIQLISFNKAETKEILTLLDIQTKVVEKKEFLLKVGNQIARCEECKHELTTDNLGNVAKGSKLLFCDNPACFAAHLANKNY